MKRYGARASRPHVNEIEAGYARVQFMYDAGETPRSIFK